VAIQLDLWANTILEAKPQEKGQVIFMPGESAEGLHRVLKAKALAHHPQKGIETHPIDRESLERGIRHLSRSLHVFESQTQRPDTGFSINIVPPGEERSLALRLKIIHPKQPGEKTAPTSTTNLHHVFQNPSEALAAHAAIVSILKERFGRGRSVVTHNPHLLDIYRFPVHKT